MSEKILNRVAGAFVGGSPGPRGCLPGRPPKARRPSRPPGLERARPKAPRSGAEDLLVLEFAHLSLNRGGQVDGEPSEMVVSMRPGKVTREGVNAIVGLMNKVLDLPDVYGWFAVTFDFRAHRMPSLQLETALHIMRWDCEPGWQARCLCQCAHCVILVEASMLLDAKQQLASWYSFRPPPYSTYLATEPAGECGADDSAVRFSPPKSWPAPALAPAPSAAQVPPSPGSSAPSTPVPGGGGRATSKQPPGQAVSRQPRPVAAPPSEDKEFFESGFVYVAHFPRSDGRRELLVQCSDREQSDEALDGALDFMDRFVRDAVAEGGFSITYDFRGLRMPSLSMVMRIAAWGNQPARAERFQKFNFACKVVFSPGLAFTIGKGLLGLFFTQCPPVVRTYVLADPTEAEEEAVHFDPLPKANPLPEISVQAGVGCRLREARLPGQDDAGSSGVTLRLLDVGFANLALSLASGRSCELRIHHGSGAPDRAGVSALVQLMLHILSLPQVCRDFELTFDLRDADKLEDSLDLVFRARRWRNDPEWQRVCLQRCVGWSLLVKAGRPFQLAHEMLDSFFYLHPPACPIRLGSSPEGARAKAPGGAWLPREAGGLLGDAASDSSLQPQASARPPWRGSGLPCNFDAGFLRLSCGPGELNVSAQKGAQTEEGLSLILAFLDDFCHCRHAEGGFTARLDLRGLQLPSLETVCRLAVWSAVPRRRERWQHLCTSCSVVAGEGLTFFMAKGLLSKFFSLSPPAARTFLLHTPDDDLDAALFFAPPGCESEAEVGDGYKASAYGAEESVLRPIYALGFGGQRLSPDDDPWVF